MHILLVGIEHLMTGIHINADMPITYSRESPSVMRLTCDAKIEAYWPVKQIWLESTEAPYKAPEEYSAGEVEYYAKVVAESMVDAHNRLWSDSQTYTRHFIYTDKDGNRTRYAPKEPSGFPMAVVKAMMRKHGKDVFTKLAELRWNGDHWFYYQGSMYVGVEPDGHIHT